MPRVPLTVSAVLGAVGLALYRLGQRHGSTDGYEDGVQAGLLVARLLPVTVAQVRRDVRWRQELGARE